MMEQLWVTPPDEQKAKRAHTTPNKELDYCQQLEREYKEHGFSTLWVNISHLDFVH